MNRVIDFRKYIKEQIQLKGITIYELAKQAGLRSRISLYTYLQGKTNITSKNLTKVIEALQGMTQKK